MTVENMAIDEIEPLQDCVQDGNVGSEKVNATSVAVQRHLGRCKVAKEGALCLDEIGEPPDKIQLTLLHVLHENDFELVGRTPTIRSEIRLISATNRDLNPAVDAGRFASEFYYRISVFPIEMPPCCRRKENIPNRAEYFMRRFANNFGKRSQGISTLFAVSVVLGRRDRRSAFAIQRRHCMATRNVAAPLGYQGCEAGDDIRRFKLEIPLLLAHNTSEIIATTKERYQRADRSCIYIGIRGAEDGLPAIEESILAGVGVNVTILLSGVQYQAAAEAYVRRLERCVEAGFNPHVDSVASVFVDCRDVTPAGKIPAAPHKQPGVAAARRISRTYRGMPTAPFWHRAFNSGSRLQRLLGASNGTKGRKASDLLYFKALAPRLAVNRMPEVALNALADHGEPGFISVVDLGDSDKPLTTFTHARVKLEVVTDQLQEEQTTAFVIARNQLMNAFRSARDALKPTFEPVGLSS